MIGTAVKSNQTIRGENVLGYIEGTDLKNELIIITAHYDHLGKHDSLIFNGADDDASGVAGAKSLVQKILLQVNAGKDPAKFGISIEECEPVIEKALSFESVDVLGFMTIAPFDPENNSTAQYAFEKLGSIFIAFS